MATLDMKTKENTRPEEKRANGSLQKTEQSGAMDAIMEKIRKGLATANDQDLGILFNETFANTASSLERHNSLALQMRALHQVFMKMSNYFKDADLVSKDKFCCVGFELNSVLTKMCKDMDSEAMGKMFRIELTGMKGKGKEIKNLLQLEDNSLGKAATSLIQKTFFDGNCNKKKKRKRIPCEHKGQTCQKLAFQVDEQFIGDVKRELKLVNEQKIVDLTKKEIQKIKDDVLGRRCRSDILPVTAQNGIESILWALISLLDRRLKREGLSDCCMGMMVKKSVNLMLNYSIYEQGEVFRREFHLINKENLAKEDPQFLSALVCSAMKKIICDGKGSSEGSNCTHPDPPHIVDPNLFENACRTDKEADEYTELLHNPLKPDKIIKKMVVEYDPSIRSVLKSNWEKVGKTFNEFWDAIFRRPFEDLVRNFTLNIVRSPTKDSTTSQFRRATFQLFKEADIQGFEDWNELYSLTQRYDEDRNTLILPLCQLLVYDLDQLGTIYRKCLRGLEVRDDDINYTLKQADTYLGRFSILVVFNLLFPEDPKKQKIEAPLVFDNKIRPMRLNKAFYDGADKKLKTREKFREELKRKVMKIKDETLGRRWKSRVLDFAEKGHRIEEAILAMMNLFSPFFLHPEDYSPSKSCCFGREIKQIMMTILPLPFDEVLLTQQRNGDILNILYLTVPSSLVIDGKPGIAIFGVIILYLLENILFQEPFPDDEIMCRHEREPFETEDILKTAMGKIDKEKNPMDVLNVPVKDPKMAKKWMEEFIFGRSGTFIDMDDFELEFNQLVFKLHTPDFAVISLGFKLHLITMPDSKIPSTNMLKKAVRDIIYSDEFSFPIPQKECLLFDKERLGRTLGHLIYQMMFEGHRRMGEFMRESLARCDDSRIKNLLKKPDSYLGILFFVLLDMFLLTGQNGSGEDGSLYHDIMFPNMDRSIDHNQLRVNAATMSPRHIASCMRKMFSLNRQNHSLVAENIRDIMYQTFRYVLPELQKYSESDLIHLEDKQLAKILQNFIDKGVAMGEDLGIVVRSILKSSVDVHHVFSNSIPSVDTYWSSFVFVVIKRLIFDRDIMVNL
ncbi:unnamed protein product [Bursaphelenchus xylophilus]|nr:unnamed protein product [Bursaphelenchus xylophilus]CAG9082862.1 unnamed protein product [Bursaphelenchus xylophilus]